MSDNVSCSLSEVPLPPTSLTPIETSFIKDCDDIGLLLRSIPQNQIRNLSASDKYSLFVNRFKPTSSFKFPCRYLDGCNRSCQHKYLEENPWFVYSKAEDGIFCLPCVLFATKENLGQFVCSKFNVWSKKSIKFAAHNSKQYHNIAMARMDALKSSMVHSESSIESCIKKINESEIIRNRYVLKCIIEAILFCGRQCISLRGHRDDSTASCDCNRGNFLALLDYSIKSGNASLAKHLQEAGKNAMYTSKTIQNDLIECIGMHIRGRILKEIKEANFYSVLCDEVVDVACKQQVSIVLRFVDSGCNIREEFLDFIKVERITGEVLAREIKNVLARYGLDLQNCRGQGYDGATNMSGANGVQGLISAENSKAVYVHCNSHVLNLCIVDACSLRPIRNMSSAITETANFFHNSAKRQVFLEKVVDNRTSTVKVKDLCRTRWIYRHEAYENFSLLYTYLVEVMEAICENDTSHGVMDWDHKTVVAANGLSKMYRSFSFIISFIVTRNAMSIIKPISVKLQYTSNDIVKAYNRVEEVVKELHGIRNDESMLHSWYAEAESLAGKVDVVPQVPRTASRQQHRDNVQHGSTEEYYRRSVILPLLDNLIQQMNDRFGRTQKIVAKLINLVPSVITTLTDLSYEDATSFFADDLPSSSLVPTEVWRWRQKWCQVDAAEHPTTLYTALQACDKDFFPNIYVFLRIACTVPVTACENERANSVLKNLKTFLRNTMGQERLSSLALMHIHYSLPIDFDNVIDTFKLKCNRRISL